MDLPAELGQRIGVLGGTFDPVHNGHLALVEAAFAGLDLDSLILVPAAIPPHKRDLVVTPLVHRLTMLRLAIAGRRGVYVTSLEAERPGPSFSVDTLAVLRRHFGSAVKLFFLVGIDAFVEIQSWKEYRQVPLLADLVVVDRGGVHSPRLDEAVPSRFGDYCLDVQHGGWRGANGHGVISPLVMEPVVISSSIVRQRVAGGSSIDSFLPKAVSEFIFSQQLYRP